MNKIFHSNNRLDLINSLDDEKCMVVLSSGYEVVKSADENFPFQVNSNFYYLTGIKQPNVHLILLKDGNNIIELLYIEEYDEMFEKWIGHRLTKNEACKLSGIYLSNISYLNDFESNLYELANEYKTVYFDLEKNDNINFNSFGLTYSNSLARKNKSIEIKDIYKNVILLRMVKKPCEIKAFKDAIEITRIGIESLMNNCKEGMYEYQLESYFDFEIKQHGNREYSFKTIAASGMNATTLHYSSNNSILKNGDLILFDLGCKVDGYCADISRTFPIDGKFTPLQKKIYNIVLKANKEISKIAKAGMTIKELQEICKNILAEGCLKAKLIKNKEDISKYYFHSVSHGIGLDTHDPMIKTIPLPVNAIISNEPGLYFPEYGVGIRIEDDLLIKKDHSINLSKSIIKSVNEIEKFMDKK